MSAAFDAAVDGAARAAWVADDWSCTWDVAKADPMYRFRVEMYRNEARIYLRSPRPLCSCPPVDDWIECHTTLDPVCPVHGSGPPREVS
jgi:hypothetical protein